MFVSSTFSDFIAEREALQHKVFPELEKYCAERGALFQAVDLRWGITEEAQREHDTISATHQEIVLGALSARDEQGSALDPEQYVHVYARHLQGMPSGGSAQDFIDWDASFGQVVPGARDRLRGLEKTPRERLPGHFHDLHTTWSRHCQSGAVDNGPRAVPQLVSEPPESLDRRRARLSTASRRAPAARAGTPGLRKALLGRIARSSRRGAALAR